MSTAARAASRNAGRGTSLGTAQRPTPVTRIPHRRQHPIARPAAGRGAPLRGELAPSTSSLTASVLRNRDRARQTQGRNTRLHIAGHGIANQMSRNLKPSSGSRNESSSKRRITDWYTSAARQEALAGLAQATSELEEASKRPAKATQRTQPFAWADLGDVVNQLPDGHWAHGYVSGVANSIERNYAMDGDQKELVLGEVLQALGRLSREDEERFQDAES